MRIRRSSSSSSSSRRRRPRRPRVAPTGLLTIEQYITAEQNKQRVSFGYKHPLVQSILDQAEKKLDDSHKKLDYGKYVYVFPQSDEDHVYVALDWPPHATHTVHYRGAKERKKAAARDFLHLLLQFKFSPVIMGSSSMKSLLEEQIDDAK
jgi:hypothetical protein